jgi:CRP-like cAMP-binding protein
MTHDFTDFPVFRGLNATQVENFIGACTDAARTEGEALIQEGDHEDHVYLLYEGQVAILVDGPDGPRELAAVSAPAVLGEMEFLTGEPRSASVVARTPVRTLEIRFDTLRARLEDGDPGTLKIFYNVATVLAHRLAAMDKKLSEMASDAPDRTADLVAFQHKLFGEWNI